MKIAVKYGNNIKEFENRPSVVIGSTPDCDFVIPEAKNVVLKFIYSQKYNNFVLINANDNKNILLNNRKFSKVLVTPKFTITSQELQNPIEICITANVLATTGAENSMVTNKSSESGINTNDDIFNNDIEKHRIAIIKEIGFKILDLKGSIRSAGITSFILNAAIVILSIVSSFGITNYLLGFKIDNSSSVLNLTTNVGFLAGTSAIVLAICLILKHGFYSLLEVNSRKRLGETNIAQKSIITVSSVFLFIVYVMNLFYYKAVPGFAAASLFISLLFVGALASVTIASGYYKFQIREDKQQLTNCEYREDFESVMKSYRKLINTYINRLSTNRINTLKSNLVNCQLKMIVEVFIGLLTSPFLAYGVSNTLAGCFPEAANWVRISGLRFSPIFLVLATFLIIFAFFSFVRTFTIGKQIKASEIIKFDGFHDYNSHGVVVLGLDSMRNLEKEKNVVMFIACFIILIEFTMNVSYFITEIGGDIQGMFLSIVTALVPTALLIAETHWLADTMFKIHIYNDLLSNMD